MYSSSTILVFTMGNGVNGFTLDPMIGEFVMTHPDIQVPSRGKVSGHDSGGSGWSWPWESADVVFTVWNETKQIGFDTENVNKRCAPPLLPDCMTLRPQVALE